MRTLAIHFIYCFLLFFVVVSVNAAPGDNEKITYIFDGKDCLNKFGKAKSQLIDFERNQTDCSQEVMGLGQLEEDVCCLFLKDSDEEASFKDSYENAFLYDKPLPVDYEKFDEISFLGLESYIGEYVRVSHVIDQKIVDVEGVFSGKLFFGHRAWTGRDDLAMVKALLKISPEDVETAQGTEKNFFDFEPKGEWWIVGQITGIERLRPGVRFVPKGCRPDEPVSRTIYRPDISGKGRLAGNIISDAGLAAKVFYCLYSSEKIVSQLSNANISLQLELKNDEWVDLKAKSARVVFRDSQCDFTSLYNKNDRAVYIEQNIDTPLLSKKVRQYSIQSANIALSRSHTFTVDCKGKNHLTTAYQFANDTDHDLPYGVACVRHYAQKDGYDCVIADIAKNVRKGEVGEIALRKSELFNVTAQSDDSGPVYMKLSMRHFYDSTETIKVALPFEFLCDNQQSVKEKDSELWTVLLELKKDDSLECDIILSDSSASDRGDKG